MSHLGCQSAKWHINIILFIKATVVFNGQVNHKELFPLSTLKVNKFRPVLIADLWEVPARPHLQVCVCAYVFMWMCRNAFMHVFGLSSLVLTCRMDGHWMLQRRGFFLWCHVIHRHTISYVFLKCRGDDDMLCLVCSNLWVMQVWTYKEQIRGPHWKQHQGTGNPWTTNPQKYEL